VPYSTSTASNRSVLPLPIRRVDEIAPPSTHATWLIEHLWFAQGVGLLGGHAKVCKTYLATELSLAVATGKHALGSYPTLKPGPVPNVNYFLTQRQLRTNLCIASFVGI
jgi:RecA-family ATPase